MVVFVILIFCFSNIAVGQTWQFFEVDEGVKPELAITSQDNPNISYMLEDHTGYVRHAVFNSSTLMFDNSQPVTGYFYGPLDRMG
jgi:hypothetical protein